MYSTSADYFLPPPPRPEDELDAEGLEWAIVEGTRARTGEDRARRGPTNLDLRTPTNQKIFRLAASRLEVDRLDAWRAAPEGSAEKQLRGRMIAGFCLGQALLLHSLSSFVPMDERNAIERLRAETLGELAVARAGTKLLSERLRAVPVLRESGTPPDMDKIEAAFITIRDELQKAAYAAAKPRRRRGAPKSGETPEVREACVGLDTAIRNLFGASRPAVVAQLIGLTLGVSLEAGKVSKWIKSPEVS